MLLHNYLIIALAFLSYVICSCKHPQLRILGGTDVSAIRFRYQASIEIKGRFYCGAVIIHQKFILTAAHCIYHKSLNEIKVRAGTSVKKRFGQVADIASITIPSEYPRKQDFDIAILELTVELGYSIYIQPIKLANEDDTLEVGSKGIITGFGRTKKKILFSIIRLGMLQCLETKVIPRSYCERFPNFSNATFCAGSLKPQIGACSGDSGSPFVFQSKLYGLVSTGFICTHRQLYEIYVSIPYFLPLIKDTICYFHNYTLSGIC